MTKLGGQGVVVRVRVSLGHWLPLYDVDFFLSNLFVSVRPSLPSDVKATGVRGDRPSHAAS